MQKILFIIFFLFGLVNFSFGQLNKQGLISRIEKSAATAEAKVGVAFIDLKTGWTMQVNGSEEFPAASVAKLAVMACAYHLAETGEINLLQKITLKESDKLGGSGILQWMKAGRSYPLNNLIRMMIVLSDNTATKMVIDAVGLEEINTYLNGLDLRQTKILDATMLNELPSQAINTTSPNDMAQLILGIQARVGFSDRSSKQMLAFMKNQRYRWGIWRGVPPGTKVADKTGNLEGILNDVGIVYTKSGNYILSIFTQGFKKQRPARLLINEISKAAYEEYTGEKVFPPKKRFKKKIIKRRSPRRPSLKSKQRSGHRGAVLDHKSHSYLRQ